MVLYSANPGFPKRVEADVNLLFVHFPQKFHLNKIRMDAENVK